MTRQKILNVLFIFEIEDPPILVFLQCLFLLSDMGKFLDFLFSQHRISIEFTIPFYIKFVFATQHSTVNNYEKE